MSLSASFIMPDAVIYDWDNTLIDTFPLLFKATNAMREHFGLPAFDEEQAKRNIRLSARDSLPKIFGDRWQEAYDFYLSYVKAHHLAHLDFIEGADLLVRFFEGRGVKQAVFSNKTNIILRPEVELFSVEGAFSAVVGSGDFIGLGKPDAAGLLYTAELLSIDESSFNNVWYVGDTENDLLAARAAGMVPVFIENETMSDEAVVAAIKPQYRFKNCAECVAYLTTVS